MKTQGPDNCDETIVQLENLYKIYRMGNQDVKALAGINISFSRGSFWAAARP